MTTKPNTSRSQFVRQRRTSRFGIKLGPKSPALKPAVKVAPRRSYHPESVYLPGTPRLDPSGRKTRSYRSQTGSAQYAFSLGRAEVRAPAISLPQFGPRWLSAAATALLVFLLFTLWNSSTFAVSGAELRGAQRLDAAEINAALGLTGQPIFTAVPARLSAELRADFPDVSAASVHVGLPNRVVVDVTERTPLLAWTQNGAVTWIDADGIAFPPRGAVQGLIPVSATGTPPQAQADATVPLYARPYLPPAMVQAMITLYPYLPKDVTMTYDPQYGMGWNDARGWSVYFGQGTADIPMKIKVYQAIVDTLTSQGIQPSLISVEYLDAPFYK
jgi:cell division protein FtsQ